MAPAKRPAALISTIYDLPIDIISIILSHVSPEDLIRCMCVLKSWNAVIHTRKFQKAHLNRCLENNMYRTMVGYDHNATGSAFFSSALSASDEFSAVVKVAQPLRQPRQRTYMVGCCNGLTCLHNGHDLALWNPSIRKFRRVPFTAIEPPAETKARDPVYGFGYDSVSDDFKIVRVVEFYLGGNCVGSEVKIFSLNSNSWRSIGSLPHHVIMYNSSDIHINDSIHWESNRNTVLALHFTTESFEEFDFPVVKYKYDAIGLEVVKGKLCICFNVHIPKNEVWIMEEYGSVASWRHLYTIEQGPEYGRPIYWRFEYCKPMIYVDSSKKVLLMDNSDLKDDGIPSTNLFWYDVEKNTGTELIVPGMPQYYSATICVASIFLLDDDPVTVGRQQRNRSRRVVRNKGG